MTTDNFGNLSFSNYTMETDAECQILALQAALRVQGYTATHPAMKKVLRLKRSMGRNKVRRYTFNLVPAKAETPVEEPRPIPTNDYADLLAPILERVTGLTLHSKESKLATSGHLLVKFVLAGTIRSARIEPAPGAMSQTKAREAIALEVMRNLGTVLTSFSVQPFRTKVGKGCIGVSVQCIYRGPSDKKSSA